MNAMSQPLGASPLPCFGEPKWEPQDPNPEASELEPGSQARKLKVIVIDDEALIADTVAEILNHAGLDATPVSDPVEAIRLAQTMQPDVVLSDVIMPGMNGIEAGIRIREMVPRCRIILFSGQAATVDLLEKARKQGHHFDILGKPIKPEQLISVIRTGFRS
jgi:CheY-like chemotaxis protein